MSEYLLPSGFKDEVTFNAYVEHQYKNTECGMYSLYFIITLLTTHKDPKSFKLHSS